MFLNFVKSQAGKPGFWLFEIMVRNPRRCALGALFCVSLFLVGSCNTSAQHNGLSFADASSSDFAGMSKGELMQHAYELQNITAEKPDALTDLAAREVSLMLAEPDLERKDLPSVVWQYRSQSCVLDVYYTVEGEIQTSQVQHFEFRERELITKKNNDESVVAWNCLQSLYSERRAMIEKGFEQIYAQASENDGAL